MQTGIGFRAKSELPCVVAVQLAGELRRLFSDSPQYENKALDIDRLVPQK